MRSTTRHADRSPLLPRRSSSCLTEDAERGSRPPCLGEPRGPQDRVQQRTVEQLADVVPMVQILDIPGPQGVDQLVEACRHLDLHGGTGLQGFSQGQGTTARSGAEFVNIPVPGLGGESSRGGLQGSRARQNSIARAVEHNIEIPAVRGLQGFPLVRVPQRPHPVPGTKKVRRHPPVWVRGCTPVSAHPRRLFRCVSGTGSWSSLVRPYFWDRRTGETCWEMEKGYLASWWLRPDGFYVRVADGTVFETIDDL